MLTNLKLTHLRSHPQGHFHLSPLTVIIGPNGSGKTNILEAISFLSTTRSWRTSSDSEMISHGQNFARLESDRVAAFLQRDPYKKQFFIDGVKLPIKDVVGRLKTVLFEPEDLQLILGSPSTRRHFLNVVLAQADRGYGAALVDLHKVLAQRNRLLKRVNEGVSGQSELNFWDAELKRLSTEIWQRRSLFISEAKATLQNHYQSVSGDKKEITIKLETHPADTDRLEEELAALREREVAARQTLRGPHRDDLILKMAGAPARAASRGEVRCLTFALKMIELDHLEAASRSSSEGVTLLLDDVMSELDHLRRERLVSAAQRVQTVITATDLNGLPASLRREATVIELS